MNAVRQTALSNSGQSRGLLAFNLDDVVPQDHLLRDIDRVLDFSGLREHLAPYYSHTGRPSIDPELMIRMMLIGYRLGNRSDRLLCKEVTLNLAYRWFCKLKISDPVPDQEARVGKVATTLAASVTSFQKNRSSPVVQAF